MTRHLRILVLLIALCFLLMPAAFAGINPHEVVVVVNNHPDVAQASRAIAEYYCEQRSIPASNIVEVRTQPQEDIKLEFFYPDIVQPLRLALQSLGSVPDHPETDPIKCIVLCYGFPLKIEGDSERSSSVDGPLTMLFSTAPWGSEPIGEGDHKQYNHNGQQMMWNYALHNPYWEGPYMTGMPWRARPEERTKPTDFGEFRASSYNIVTETSPAPRVVRMLDSNHAIAGGGKGAIYRREQVEGTWKWVVTPDKDKGFVVYDINDICVISATDVWACSSGGTILHSTDAGVHWTPLRLKHSTFVSGVGVRRADSVLSLGFAPNGSGWIVGRRVDAGGEHTIPFIEKTADGNNWTTISLPTGLVTPAAVTVADVDNVWVSGESGIWFTSDGGVNWSHPYSDMAVGDIWGRKVGDEYHCWAVASNGRILQMQSYPNEEWSPVGPTSVPSGNADLAVYDWSHLSVAYGEDTFITYDGTTWRTETSSGKHLSSVAWHTGGTIAACDTTEKAMLAGEYSPEGIAWTGSHIISNAHWKMRYMVCRLDGYATPLDDEYEDPVGIPADVRGMIDRSVNATARSTS